MLKTDELDVYEIIKDFPILSRRIRGRRLVYLDNAATTQKPIQVIKAVDEFYLRHNANIHRSVHTLGEEATELYENARKKVASFINSREEEVVFTRGTTESINLVRYSWVDNNVGRGESILTTMMEHHSNIVPWQLSAKKSGARLRYVNITDEGLLDYEELERLISDAKFLAITHCSNVLGTVNDLKRICKIARENNVVTLVDAAQSAPHMKIDVNEIGCDFLAFSGHKMLAPNGIGVLYARKELLEQMEPFHGGGDMIKEVFLDHATWNDIPYKFEAGTVNTGGAVGLAAAIDYLNKVGMEKISMHERKLTSYCIDSLSRIKEVEVYGPKDVKNRIGVVSFNVSGIHPHDVATILDEYGVAIRSGHHCAQPLMTRYGVSAMNRASFYLYNTFNDVDVLIKALKKAIEVFS